MNQDPDVPAPIRVVGPEASDSGRIPLCVRIGVIGHRALDDVERMTVEVDVAVDDILRRVPCSAESRGLQPIAVSALAEGADRLVAERVLQRDRARLEVVLPMTVADYEQTFSDDGTSSVGRFEGLLAQAALTLIEPERVEEGGIAEPEREFLAAGERVAKLSDVVIAIWDGEDARGKG
ncbi:MAG: hypothetical protein QOE07_1557, partial [Acidimicrobiaceae bacterium]|nr:hypothetical protein [Acidimicrobiaceae bacterium]